MMRTARSGRSDGFLTTLLIMLGLLAGMARGQRSVDPIDRPQFLQVELVEGVPPGFGVNYYKMPDANVAIRLLKATWHSGWGLRAGVSAFDYGGTPRHRCDGLSVGAVYCSGALRVRNRVQP